MPSVTALLPDLTRLRHELHRHPDVSGAEGATAARVRAYLAAHGLEPVAGDVGGSGLLYRVDGDASRDDPTRLFRADLDALPLQEASDVPHASTLNGRHHACGHDGHMTMLAGALALLHADRGAFTGTVLGLFQPAEETGAGMARALRHPALADARVDRAFAFHNVPGHALGRVLVREGTAAVASTGLELHLEGATSHAAEPHAGRNPIPALADLAHVLRGAPAACLPFGHAGTVALVQVHAGGAAYGTSAGSGFIGATLRADSDADLARLVDHVERHARARADADGLALRVERVEPFPSTVNDARAVDDVRDAARVACLDVIGPVRPFPWSEDFGHATTHWPGALVGLGAGENQPDLHAPAYDFPDALIEAGVRLWCALAGFG